METTHTHPSRPAVDAQDWVSGLYRVEGRTFQNRRFYLGLVEIKRHGQAHTVVWRLAGGQVYRGLGVASQRAFAVSFPGGVILYEPVGQGWLRGVWSLDNGRVSGMEILIRQTVH